MSQKKPKRGKDGRYRLYYHGKQFVGTDLDEVRARRDDYIKHTKVGLSAENTTVKDYSFQWLPDNKAHVADKTYNSYAHMIEIMCSEIGKKRIEAVTPSDIKHIFSTHFSGMSESHIRHAKNLYQSIFDSAVEDRLCLSNPCRTKTATPAKGTSGTHRSITKEERSLIESVTAADLYPLVMTMLYAGLRNSEALALNVDTDVDFIKKEIHVKKFWHLKNSNDAEQKTKGKNRFATRTIKLFPQLEKALRDHHGYLATNKSGKTITKSGWKRAWEKYVNTIEKQMNGCQKRWYGRRKQDQSKELPEWKRFTVRPYDLRHSFCTFCRDNDIEMHVLQSWMGHADLSMISKVYDHLNEERIEKEYQKIKKLDENNTKNNTRRKVYRLKRL